MAMKSLRNRRINVSSKILKSYLSTFMSKRKEIRRKVSYGVVYRCVQFLIFISNAIPKSKMGEVVADF